MRWLNDYTMKLVLIGFVAVIVIMFNDRSVQADFSFGEPTNLGPTVKSSRDDHGMTISADGLSLYFASSQSDAENVGDWDIWVCTRETTEDEWAPAENLGPIVNSSNGEGYPSISTDGLELFFCSLYWESQRPGGCGGADIWVTRRASVFDPWETPENLGVVVNSTSHDSEPSISADGLSLYFASIRPGGEGGMDLYVTTRPTKNDTWSAPVNLGPVVNSSYLDMNPCISGDGLALFFRSCRDGGYGDSDIYLTRRATTSDPWGEPINLGPIINNSDSQVSFYISPDGSTLYFDTSWPSTGSYDLWQAPIMPIVDLNGDGIVDAEDMSIMVDHWYTDEPLCDIGPMPWGDGIVDIQDLIILAEHLFEEIPPADPNI